MSLSPSSPPEKLRELRAFLADRGIEARFDPVSAVLYSTDASNHQVIPLGVALPRHRDEAAAIVEKAAELELPLLPRGAGTSLGGQAVGPGLILDTARYLHRILSIDPETRTATVEPGVVCQALNAAAARFGLQYGPDPASADRATVGGMLGNNATGAHSIRYGMSADHLRRATMVVGDGSLVDFRAVRPEEAQRLAQEASIAGEVHRTALELRRSLPDEVTRRWPRTWRRASGYGLNYLTGQATGSPPAWAEAPAPYIDPEVIDIPAALCGSEGTLGIIVEAEVRLVPRPPGTALLLLPFATVVEACTVAVALLETSPAAIELVPATMLERAQRVPAYSRQLDFLEGEPRTLLAVEFEGETAAAAQAAARGAGFAGAVLADPRQQAAFWEVRRAGLGLLMSVAGDVKPNTFIEDVAVPVESLADYVRRVDAILADHGTYGEWYAHASAGCLHLRPMLNLKTGEGRHAMRRIAEAIVEVVCELGGAVSGEHGDGLSHTGFNERLFGPVLMAGFREWKKAFDPKGILNPGKVVVPEGETAPSIDSAMRYHEGYHLKVDVQPVFAYRREQGLLRALESCSGVGVCRKAGGVMCPSFQGTREEADSTRGRANALRAALTGSLPAEMLWRPEMRAVLDLCLECKGCRAECPTGVDMAKIKAEYLALYQRRHGTPLRSRLFGEVARLQAALAPIAAVSNAVRGRRLWRRGLEAALGIDRRRVLPKVSSRPFRSSLPGAQPEQATDGLILFVDTFTDRNETEVGEAALRVLQATGRPVARAPGQGCCGRPMISKGMLTQARGLARRNIDALAPFARAGWTIVGLEPSCLLTLRDEYLEFFPDDEAAQVVAGRTRLFEEALLEVMEGSRGENRLAFRAAGQRLWLHNHCHARALVGSAPLVELLRRSGAEVQESSAGCCGMAGSFGYEREHYDLSQHIGGMRLFPEVRAALEHGATVLAPGFSCRTQVRDGTGGAVLHPVQFLSQYLVDGG
ncbi:MAG TPA: FAD-linked oxidase C-terminal domain-containing protein [Anaerolineales bacterium]|nr:FAD-linked oxidase C-terminal domain-containing protein [Anaerolineales bacterium]